MPKLLSRQVAIDLGLPKYFTGASCPKGHIAERWISGGCTRCTAEYSSSAKGRAARNASSKRYRMKHPEKARATQRRKYYANVERAREISKQSYRRRHGVPEPTRPMPKTCECCGGLSSRRALNADHCHATGLFRGWLCTRCNTALGLLGDNMTGLTRALAYLGRPL